MADYPFLLVLNLIGIIVANLECYAVNLFVVWLFVVWTGIVIDQSSILHVKSSKFIFIVEFE